MVCVCCHGQWYAYSPKSYFCRSQIPIIHPETIRSTQMLLDSIQALASANTLWTFQGAILSMLEPFCGGHLQQKPVFFAPVGIFWYLSKRSPAVYVVLLKVYNCVSALWKIAGDRRTTVWILVKPLLRTSGISKPRSFPGLWLKGQIIMVVQQPGKVIC